MEDLQHALQLQPANKSFAKELELLKLDIAEHRRQRAVLKQLASSNSNTASPTAAGTPHKQPAEQVSSNAASAAPLNELEDLVQQLHKAGAVTTCCHTHTRCMVLISGCCISGSAPMHQSAVQSAAEKLDRESTAKAKGPSGLGKGLPLPKPKGSSQLAHGAKQIPELCAQMTKLLQASDDCRVCLRQCSGVDRLCSLLAKVCLVCPLVCNFCLSRKL